MDYGLLALLVIITITVFKGVKIVPQQQVWIVERLGRFNRQIEAGLHLIVPLIDKIAYKHTLKERAVDVMEQTAITNDNVTLQIDGVLYVRMLSAKDASYGVENPFFAVSQLAQTSMRSAIGKISLDRTFEERESLNSQIVESINEAATTWGIQCMRYEIKDIKPPISVLKAMELQVAADRQKRASILESEGKMQALINVAEASKREMVLKSEGVMSEQINHAKGEAEAILMVAQATAEGISSVAKSIKQSGGEEAVSLRVAEQYIDAFKKLAKESTSVIIPANVNDAGGIITQAMTIYNSLKDKVVKLK